MNTVVVEMTKGTTVFAWLCSRCIDARKAEGWAVKVKQVIAWGCDDCSRAAQLAPGYVTPVTVDFVATTEDARLPTEAECPRPRKIAAWAKPEKRIRVAASAEVIQ